MAKAIPRSRAAIAVKLRRVGLIVVLVQQVILATRAASYTTSVYRAIGPRDKATFGSHFIL